MVFILSTAALGAGVTFAVLLLACLAIRRDGWDRTMGLLASMAALVPVAFYFLPGRFSPDGDVANGLLLLLGLYRLFWLWVAAAVCALAIYTPVRRLADRIRPPRQTEEDTFA